MTHVSSADHTAHCFLAAPNPGRSWQKQVRAGGRKRPLATTTHHSQAPGKTASMHEDGASAPRLLGKSGSNMETSALHRPARNPTALASGALPPVLETQVKGLCWLLETSVHKLAVCTSLIFLFFHFTLVKERELLGALSTDLSA
jgi:hypothetical protein